MTGNDTNLDVLRTMAVGLVVFSHLAAALGIDHPQYHVKSLGLLGVAIFFVHTCLVLMHSLDRQAPGPKSSAFLIRRFFRIYPLAVVTVLAVAAVEGWRGAIDGGQLISNLLLVQNISGHASSPGPLWSLPYEVQMYLVLPALYLFIQSRDALRRIWMLWMVSVILVVLAWKLSLNYHLLKYLPCFLPGVLAFVESRRRHSAPVSLGGYSLPLFVFCVGAFFPALVATGVPETLMLWFVCLALGVLIPRCRRINNPLIASNCKTIATYSYGIYLIHGICIEIAFLHLSSPVAIQWVAFFGLTAGLSFVGYRLIELPCVEYGKRLAARLQVWPVDGTAVNAKI